MPMKAKIPESAGWEAMGLGMPLQIVPKGKIAEEILEKAKPLLGSTLKELLESGKNIDVFAPAWRTFVDVANEVYPGIGPRLVGGWWSPRAVADPLYRHIILNRTFPQTENILVHELTHEGIARNPKILEAIESQIKDTLFQIIEQMKRRDVMNLYKAKQYEGEAIARAVGRQAPSIEYPVLQQALQQEGWIPF